MSGVVNDYLIYPILDLIKAGVQNSSGGIIESERETNDDFDPFTGIPSIELIRNHPDDWSKTFLTRVIQTYETGYVVEVGLIYGDNATSSQDKWRLNAVTASLTDDEGELLLLYHITLHYGRERNELERTEVECLYDPEYVEDEEYEGGENDEED
jgi:NhaP-type Na+/H+ and K+/H+ antiporter